MKSVPGTSVGFKTTKAGIPKIAQITTPQQKALQNKLNTLPAGPTGPSFQPGTKISFR